MSQKDMQMIATQFARFAADNNVSHVDWKQVAMEYGVEDKANNIHRFYKSWYFDDNDQVNTASEFLLKVAEEDKDIALQIMRRLYQMANVTQSATQDYPALDFLEEEGEEPSGAILPNTSAHSQPFLDVDNVPSAFYSELIENINHCYKYGIYDATLVLTRKLLENLLIDILRGQYGNQKINLFYRPDSKRFQDFNTLISNFEENISDFEHLSGGVNGDFIDELDAFRQNANAEAHSIETNITESEIERYRKQAQHASQLLFRIRRNM